MRNRSLFTVLILTLASLGLAQVKAYPPDNPPTPSKGKVVVKVNALSEITGPRVRLGEIADITASADVKTKLEQIDMGAAPIAGIPRPVVPSRIQAALLVAGLKLKDVDLQMPAEARVALKVQKVDTAKFVEAAKQAVAPIVGPQVQLTNNQSFPDFNAPMGELTLEAGRPTKNQNGYSVLVTVYAEGKKVNSRVIHLSVDSSSVAQIKSGDTVRIYVRSAGATMEIAGRARTGGYIGQQITVVSNTGSVHQGTVLSSSEVMVKL